MANASSGLDKWRDYFRGANSDIFTVIERAIMVAASDRPHELKLKRDGIAEMLFTCKIEFCVAQGDCAERNHDDKCRCGIVEKSNRDKETMETHHAKDDGYGDVEDLTNVIEEDEELLRIKGIIDKGGVEESDEMLLHSLQRLQLMHLSVENLKTTKVGKSVNALRKHVSKEIRNLARRLIKNWKIMVDEWVIATTTTEGAEATTESVKTSAAEEDCGLPSPPLDEGAFFATPASMELSQFFDGMDDYGNLQICGGFNKTLESGRRRPEKASPDPKENFEGLIDNLTGGFEKNQEPILRKSVHDGPLKNDERALERPMSPNNGIMKPKPFMQMKAKNRVPSHKKADQCTIQKKPIPSQQEDLKCKDENFVRTKLEIAKRKLRERYQEAENAKKQRRMQVIELPKQSLTRNQSRECGSRG